MKILICMQYYEEDRLKAERVISTMCDLLPEQSELVELAFVYRQDSKPPSSKIQLKAQEKFAAVHAWKTTRHGLGHPGGCNEMAYGILNHVPIERHLHKRFSDIAAILLLESDVVFTRYNWDKELIGEWEKAVKANKLICGCVQPGVNESDRHVNGVALFDIDTANQLTCLRGGSLSIGWDYEHRMQLVPNALHSPLFFLDYRRPTINPEALFATRDGIAPLLYHGVKDNSAIESVEAMIKQTKKEQND